jgi:plastocyanin
MLMRVSKIFLTTSAILLLLFGPVVIERSRAWEGTNREVTGRVELLNSKARQSNGKIDAGGIVVALEPLDFTSPTIKRDVKMTQKEKRFIPHVVAVQTGSAVDFPNQDPFFHNVYSVFAGRVFDLGLYQAGASRAVDFKRAGVSYIFCNIHSQMSAVIVSLKTPYFSTTDVDGNFKISNVPNGRYRLKVWHERATESVLNALTRTITANGTFEISDLKIDETGHVLMKRPDKYTTTE